MKDLYCYIENRIEYLEKIFINDFDFLSKKLIMPNGTTAYLACMDGLTDAELINKSVIAPLMGFDTENTDYSSLNTISDIAEKVIISTDTRISNKIDESVSAILSGNTVVFIDGFTEYLIIQTKNFPKRSVSMPESDITIRGSKEAFTETLLTNVAMLRKRIKNSNLKTEKFILGKKSHTDCCLMYLAGTVNKEALEYIKRRLDKINVDYVLDSGQLEQILEDKHSPLFATLSKSEKPDITASKILSGRIAIIVDGTPFVLTGPHFFLEGFYSADDYYNKKLYSNLVRSYRISAYFISIIFAGLYVALMTYHKELIPSKLLIELIKSENNIPFNVSTEIMLVLTIYEILREAILRLPSQINATVGIIGGLVISDTAISIGIISAPAVIVLSITYICSAATSSQVENAVILRFAFITLASLFGIFGILSGLALMILYLSSLKTCGIPYLIPVSPIKESIIKDGIMRSDIATMQKG